MKSFSVIRVNTSPYHRPEFIQTEKRSLEEIPNITYSFQNHSTHENDLVLITNTHTDISNLDPKILKHTKLIIHPNSGYEHFEKDYPLISHIPLVIGHVIRAQAVADYIIRVALENLIELPQHISWNKERLWKRTLLRNHKVGIFGFGHVGKIVTHFFKSLGMETFVIDPYVQGCYQSWEEIKLNEIDIIISCMSLNSTSKETFNQYFFEQVKNDLLFINPARGGLVNEIALKNFLKKNPQSFAFLDVFKNEPFESDWSHFPQVWKTSHIAGVFTEIDEKIIQFEKQVLQDFISLANEDFKNNYKEELLQNKWHQGKLI
jgi:D-3-phosphoglycerate dehydrogenase